MKNEFAISRRNLLGVSVGAAAATAVAGPLRAAAGGSPVVVELFTSQGCSSCPPADAFMHDLIQREKVLGSDIERRLLGLSWLARYAWVSGVFPAATAICGRARRRAGLHTADGD